MALKAFFYPGTVTAGTCGRVFFAYQDPGDDMRNITLSAERVGKPYMFTHTLIARPELRLKYGPEPCDHWMHELWDIPREAEPGIYLIKVGSAIIGNFVVRQRKPTERCLFIVPLATSHAYNEGFYKNPQRHPTVAICRPAADNDHTLPYSEAFIKWFESEHESARGDAPHPKSVTRLDYCTSFDLHVEPTLLYGYQLVFLVGHDEYWSLDMLERLERFVLGGGNVICLSGNTAFGQVRFEVEECKFECADGSKIVQLYPRTMSLYIPSVEDVELDGAEGLDSPKFAAKIQRYLASPTGIFVNSPVLHPQNHLLGAGFTAGYWGTSGESYRFNLVPPGKHWATTGLKEPLPLFGNLLCKYETDGAEIEKGDQDHWYVTGADGTPHNFTVLAYADLRGVAAYGPGFATMGYHTRNGTVFSCGSTNWVYNLALEHNEDKTVRTITTNVVNRLLREDEARRWNSWKKWEDIGHANRITGLAATNGRLYATTYEGIFGTIFYGLCRRAPVAADVDWTLANPMSDKAPAFGPLAATRSRLFAFEHKEIPTSHENVWVLDLDKGWRSGWEKKGTIKKSDQTPITQIFAVAHVGGTLYAVAFVNQRQELLRASVDECTTWYPVTFFRMDAWVTALAAEGTILYAATGDYKLQRSRTRIIGDINGGWEDIKGTWEVPDAPCGQMKALTAIEGMLYGVCGDRLLRMDLHHFYMYPGTRPPKSPSGRTQETGQGEATLPPDNSSQDPPGV